MAKEIYWVTNPLPKGLKVRHIGLVHLDELYRWLQRWFEFKKYFKPGRDFEEFYQEITNPDGSKKIEIRWKGKKEENEYFTYHIELIFLLVGVKDVMIEKNGQQIKMQKGDYEFRIGGYLAKGMDNESNLLKRIYEKFMIKKRIEKHKFNVYDDVYELHEELSAYLNQQLQ
jgi:hypothetical protein